MALLFPRIQTRESFPGAYISTIRGKPFPPSHFRQGKAPAIALKIDLLEIMVGQEQPNKRMS